MEDKIKNLPYTLNPASCPIPWSTESTTPVATPAVQKLPASDPKVPGACSLGSTPACSHPVGSRPGEGACYRLLETRACAETIREDAERFSSPPTPGPKPLSTSCQPPSVQPSAPPSVPQSAPVTPVSQWVWKQPQHKEDVYKVESGSVLIINNEKFDSHQHRTGTQHDVDKITKFFKFIRYSVETRNNLQAADMLKYLKAFAAKKEMKSTDAVIVFILSHGSPQGILGTDGIPIPSNAIQIPFQGDKCPALVGKPKIFFLQACRGEHSGTCTQVSGVGGDCRSLGGRLREMEISSSATTASTDSVVTDSAKTTNKAVVSDGKRTHTKADILVSYSTVGDELSYRSEQDGTWYIQTLMDVFWENCDAKDLQTMLTMVNNKVQEKTVSDRDQHKCQVPQKEDTLSKTFYFRMNSNTTDSPSIFRRHTVRL